MKFTMFLEYPQGACSFYRSMGVFAYLKDIKLNLVDTVSWHRLIDTDIFYIERPNSKIS